MMPAAITPDIIEGQLNPRERELLARAIWDRPRKPQVVIEVGTWLGGGSTLHLLRTLEKNGVGHLWGVEAERGIYERMIANLQRAAPEAIHRFTPLFGFSQEVIPAWLAEQPAGFQVDVAFLDGGNRPMEQIVEFRLLAPHMPVGAILMAHDAKLRKGKWLVPYVTALDNWKSTLHDVSEEGLFWAEKLAPHPSPASQRIANQLLFKLRLEPAEIAAVIIPHPLRKLAFRLLPERYSKRYADGRKG
jgi:predicted O-methyltransferase YrrM